MAKRRQTKITAVSAKRKLSRTRKPDEMTLEQWQVALRRQFGRVHRIGQRRPVQVFNLVSEGTIEHGMLEILAFKKSVFAGVLDGGDDTVFMGETRLKKFMKQVERVTDAVPATAHEPPPEPVPEVEEPPAEEEAATVPGRPREARPPSPLQPLLETGAAFLREISSAVAESRKQGRSPLDAFVKTDPETGRPCLNVPLPEPGVIQAAASALGSLLAAFAASSEPRSE